MKTPKRYTITEAQLQALEEMAGIRPGGVGPHTCLPLDGVAMRVRSIMHAYNKKNAILDLHHNSKPGTFCKKCRAVFAKWFDASQVTEQRWADEAELRRVLSRHYGVSKKRIDWIIETRRKKRANRERSAQAS